MPDLLSWSFPLTQWAGTPVRVHLLLLVFAGSRLFAALFDPAGALQGLLETTSWLGILLAVLLIHELAEWCFASFFELPQEEIRLWPLGNFVVPSGQTFGQSPERAAIAAAGLTASLALALASGLVLYLFGYHPEWNPFGEPARAIFSWNPAGSHPRLTPLSPAWCLIWFAFLNWVLFLANLIPALPFDMGRICRDWLGGFYRDREISPYIARVFAGMLGLAGLFRLSFHKPGGLILLSLALLIEWLVRNEARILEENGYFEEGAFGYDFSQGYTSLDAEASRVRPQTEGTLVRWRQKQSEQRKLRRERKTAAEAMRLDEILEKLHVSGKASLTREEQRFLVRVSQNLRSRKS